MTLCYDFLRNNIQTHFCTLSFLPEFVPLQIRKHGNEHTPAVLGFKAIYLCYAYIANTLHSVDINSVLSSVP